MLSYFISAIKEDFKKFERIVDTIEVGKKISVLTNKLIFFNESAMSFKAVEHKNVSDHLKLRKRPNSENYELFDPTTNFAFYIVPVRLFKESDILDKKLTEWIKDADNKK